MFTIKTEKFEGPLDLLLRLIEKEEMNISEISLAKLTDEYILHIEGMEDLNPAEMADFLVVAARLLWIKSKTLLPTLETGVDGAGDLAEQLKIYKEYKDASIVVGKMIAKNNFTYTRDKLPLGAGDSFFNPPAWLSKEKIKMVLKEILDDLEPIVRLPKGMVKGAISIQEKIRELKDIVRRDIEFSFQSIVNKAKNKVEVIVNFLALLGWAPGEDREIMSLEEMIKLFSLEKINKASPVFDQTKLDHFNSLYIRQLSAKELADRILEFDSSLQNWAKDREFFEKAVKTVQERLVTLKDAKEMLEFYFIEPK